MMVIPETNLLTLSVPDDGYSRNVWCLLNYKSTVF
jgi:hypothetical protein